MRISKRLYTSALVCLCSAGSATRDAVAPPSPDRVLTEAGRVADAELPVMAAKGNVDWLWGVMEAGLAEFAQVSPSGARYRAALTAAAERARWTPATAPKVAFHADDFCIGQAYLDLEGDHPESAELRPLRARLDALVDHLNVDVPGQGKLTWSWCDALFMAPPVLAHLSAVTHDRRYLEAMDKEFWRTTGALYDPGEHLFFRDARFVHKLDAAGKKVFWGRGNGWVVGGLVRVLAYMPEDFPSRPKYVSLYRDMVARLATLQSGDGTWHSSLLEPDQFPEPETSGTALITYAMAWGIHHGILDRGTYLPHVLRGWNAVLDDRRPDGLPGHVQGVASQPGPTTEGGTQPYATGALLMAAVELDQLDPDGGPVATPATTAPAAPQRAAAAATRPARVHVRVPDPPAGTTAYARYVPERMDDIAWENDRIAHRDYGPALQHNPHEHSGSGIDVWVKSVRRPVINEWYFSNRYHVDRGTGLDFYEVGLSRGDGGLGIWDGGKLWVSKDWTEHKILDLGPDQCGFTIAYAPWDANGRSVWEHRTTTLKAGSNLDRIQSTLDSDKPGELVVGIGLAKRDGAGGHVVRDKERGILSYWQPPEAHGTIGVGVVVDPTLVVGFEEDPLNYLVLVKATPGKPLVYFAGACWDRGLDFKTADQWEQYLRDFKRD